MKSKFNPQNKDLKNKIVSIDKKSNKYKINLFLHKSRIFETIFFELLNTKI